MCSLDSASTSLGTQRPQQRDHLSRWPGAERRGPGAPGRTGPHVERESLRVCCPPHPPGLSLCGPHCQAPLTDHSGPMSASPGPPATSCSHPPCTLATAPGTVSVRTRLWSFLPITESPLPQVETTCRGRKGESGSLKEVVGISGEGALSLHSMPTNRSKHLPWVRERQKSGAPESSEETSIDTLWFLSRWRKKNLKSFSRRNLKKAHPRILLQAGLEVKQLSSQHGLERGGARA